VRPLNGEIIWGLRQ